MPNYNLLNKSDMRRFQRDFEREVRRETEKVIRNLTYECVCPNCGRKITMKAGSKICTCGQRIVIN